MSVPTTRSRPRLVLALGALVVLALVSPPRTLADEAFPPERRLEGGRGRSAAGDIAGRTAFRSRLASMIEAVQAHHVGDDLGSQRLVHGAIRGMLDTLDPHTHFLDSDSYRSMREGQDGSFYGLGIIISVRRDRSGRSRLTVISPIDGMPARRLGVRPGDIIAAIDGESTDDLTLDEAVGKLRGEKGTAVNVTIEREGERFDLSIERAEIPTESIQHAFMIRPDTGFIRVKDFTKTTTRELHESIARLLDEGMKRLVLDLRDNPGGLLDEAVGVSSTFLDSQELVVETRGRIPGSTERHVSEIEPGHLPHDMPLVVLVNRGSASASEIVAGAIQDHDRGLVVGGTTWGKGLVQSVYSLSGECGLALTTARYYTPSGRQIQRDYRSSYFDYIAPKKDVKPEGEVHVTAGGRRVLAGGGIDPDVLVEEEKPAPLVSRIIARSLFFNFAAKAHRLPEGRSITPGYELTKDDVDQFRSYLASEKLSFDAAEWAAAEKQIRTHLAAELANTHLDLKEGFKILAEADPQVQAALGLWGHAERAAILKDAKEGKTPIISTHRSAKQQPLAELSGDRRP